MRHDFLPELLLIYRAKQARHVGAAGPPSGRELHRESCVELGMEPGIAVRAQALRAGAVASGQWRAMPDGIDGIHGIGGNLGSVTSRF